MTEIGRFNTDLKLFQEELPPIETRLDHLMLIRYLVDARRLEHPAAGEPSGEIAELLQGVYTPEVEPEDLSERMRQHIEDNGSL